jgi:spore photoproduct lyase
MLDDYVDYKDQVLAEVIFLTHNEAKHLKNLETNPEAEKYLWVPSIQENKISQYGGKNIRYISNLKLKYIEQFTTLHDSIIPWNKIRYIF